MRQDQDPLVRAKMRVRNRRTGRWIELPDGPSELPYTGLNMRILQVDMKYFDNLELETRRRQWGPDYDDCKSKEKIW